MALSTIIKEECSKCGKLAIEVSRSTVFGISTIKLQCGHSFIKSATVESKADSIYESIKSKDGKKLRPYQIEGIKFWEQNDCLGVLADEQGLGKMVQSICTLALHYKKLLPVIITCPTTIKQQWMTEWIRWTPEGNQFAIQVLGNSKDRALPGFDVYIITYDILKKPEVFDFVGEIKTIILDECQRIKDHLSGRAKAVQAIIRSHNIKHIMPMSGTPIKNNAGEYFTVLNLVAPRLFPHYDRFITKYCNSYDSWYGSKVGGLNDPTGFREITKDIVLRRTKEEVLPDLPKLDRKFYHVELDRKLNKAYAQALDDLDKALYDDETSEFEKSSNTLAILTRLRQITGISKVTEAVDFTTEFLLSCERKIVLFVHHNAVADLLNDKLTQWCKDGGFDKPLMMHSGLNGDGRANLAREFKDNPRARIMIASTLAAGEGLNLQFCSDAVILERQWNPANEEQAEARFHRFGQENPVSITYMLASSTIDEYFTELVEQKRSLVAAALDGKEIDWNESGLMKELATILVTRGRQKWSL